MNKYVEIKILKKHLVIIGVILLLICGMFGFYVWSSYHPDINIKVSASSAGENLSIEAPHIAYANRNGIDIAPSIQLNITNLYMQHELTCMNLKDNYKQSDIKLDMKVKDNKTILNYYGTATDLKDETVDYENEIVLDFVLNAKIDD